MASFNPYHKWLGIPPNQQPVSHYRLLGIEEFEFDADVIEIAAERQTLLLRTFQTGTNSELAERLLNEISAARVCLLDGKSKARYDTQLKATLEPVPEDDPLGFTTEELAPIASTRQRSRQRSRGGKPFWQEPWAIPAGAGGGAIVMLLIMLMLWPWGAKPSVKKTANTAQNSKREAASLTKPIAKPSLAVAPFDATQAKGHQDAWSKYLGVPVEYTNSIGMKFMLIPPGEFMMGSPESEEGHREDELPHHVRLTKPFYLGSCEVTAGQHNEVMAGRLSKSPTDDFPVLNASWYQAVSFAHSLSNRPEEKGVKNTYRLPTEAEWEYACRAGTTTMYSFGEDAKHLGDYGWFKENSGAKAHPVGKKTPNRWGLYDMHGNVWEWYWQWQVKKSDTSTINFPRSLDSNFRGIRGGCWFESPNQCRSAAKMKKISGFKHDRIGFRVVLEIPVRARPNTIGAATKSLPPSLQKGLIAYYPFNGNAQDESGNGHHGVIYGARLATDRHVLQEKAFAFKHGHYIQLPPKLLSQQETLAMSAWCKPAFLNAKKWPRIVGGNGNALAKNISINIGQRVADQKKRFVFELETEAGNIVAESPEIPVEHWFHVAMVSDGQSLTCFLNGKRIAKKTVIGKLVTMKTLTVGSPNSSFHYEGAVDDIRIYNRALSVAEVQQLYEFESSGTAAATASNELYLTTLRPFTVESYKFTPFSGKFSPERPITVNGQSSPYGMRLYPRLTKNDAVIRYILPSTCRFLSGAVVVENYGGNNTPTLTFHVSANGNVLWKSPPMTKGDNPVGFCVPLNDSKNLVLKTTCSHSAAAWSVWLDPVLLKSTGGKSLEEIAKEQQARWLKNED